MMVVQLHIVQGEVNQNQENPEKYNIILRGTNPDSGDPAVFIGEMDFDEFTEPTAIEDKFSDDIELDA